MLNCRSNFLIERVEKLLSFVVLFLINLYFCLCFLPLESVQSEVLQGQVEQEDELLRVKRPEVNHELENSLSGLPSAAPSRFDSKLVDLNAFSAPIGAQAAQNNFNGTAQLARSEQFGNIGDDKFDLGSERGSKELVLAWTKWHHQLSQAIYSRWARLADTAGQATVRMTVSRDRSVQLVMVHPSGNQEFDRTLLQAIFSLNGNPGLTFPAGSQRQQVSLESDYVAGRNIDPGYNWVTDDYEKVQESY
jgi:hypothetical protein